VALAVLVGFAAWTRASGFSGGSLWFDDAWTALPARVPLSTALRMVTTAPGYTVGLRGWLRLHPRATWWAQLPAFVAGLGGVVAVLGLLRYHRVWPPLAYLGALVVAASPVAIAYSTRVKQFGLDLLAACLVLYLLERWRRQPGGRAAALLATACAASLLVSATTLVVVVPVAVVAALHGAVARERRRDAAVVAGSALGALVVVWAVWLRHLSPRLDVGWRTRGYLLTTTSVHRAAFSLEAMGTGLLHYLLAVPTGRHGGTAITAAGVALALCAAAVLAALVVPPLVALASARGLPGPRTAPALTVVLAVALALAARSPFGAGRTDEVLYPALLVLAAVPLTRLVERASPRVRRAAVATCVAAAIGLVAVGSSHRAAYPTTYLRPLAAELRHHVRPGELVVVDPWLTFTWAYDGITPTAVSFAPTPFPWSQGFHVVSLRRTVVISENYFFAGRSYSRLSRRARRLWYVAATLGRQSGLEGVPSRQLKTVNYLYLRQLGWQPSGRYLTASHTEAILLVYRPATASARAARRASTRSSSREVTAASS
jgi:hypothetical protein